MNNHKSILEIFELCERLSELLGDKEAIADLQKLYNKHPEMFEDMQDVKEVISAVVSTPEIIVNANRDNRDYKVFKAAKVLGDKKMADVVIKNESGINEIFHTNKKRIKEFSRLKNKENLLQVETPTPSTHQLNGLELMDKNPSGADALSANVIADGRDAQLLHSSPSLDERLVQKNISSTNNTLAQNSKHTTESTTNNIDFTQKAIDFINKQQAKYDTKTIQQTYKR